MRTHALLIGSVGDDSHSIGMKLLEMALREERYCVKNIGILNSLDDFFAEADHFDVFMISCVNGHSDLYISGFPYKLHHYNLADHPPKLWYIGGNLSVNQPAEDVKRLYLQMGFDFVSPKPLHIKEVLRQLRRDIALKEIPCREVGSYHAAEKAPAIDFDAINDTPLDQETFDRQRNEVLTVGQLGLR